MPRCANNCQSKTDRQTDSPEDSRKSRAQAPRPFEHYSSTLVPAEVRSSLASSARWCPCITHVRAVAQPRAMSTSRRLVRGFQRAVLGQPGAPFAVCAPRVRRESRPSSVAQPSSDADPGRCCRLGVRVRDRPNHTGDRARRAHAVRQLRRRPLASLQLHGLDDGRRRPWLGHGSHVW